MAGPPGESGQRHGLSRCRGGKLQRHAGIGYEIVQSLDVPVLQMVEQLPNVTQFFAAHVPVFAELVIEVPKIWPDRDPQRIVERRPPQMAEQLVVVPTEPVYVLMVLASKVFSRRELSGLLSGQGFNSVWVQGFGEGR